MRFRYGDGSFRAISDVKKALQAFGDGFNVDRVQNIGTKRRIPFFSEVATSDAEIVRREIPFDDGDEKVVVQVFDETVDGVCEFARFVKRTQMPEVTARLIAGETVLNVAGNGGVDVSAGRFVVREGGAFVDERRIIKRRFTGEKGTAAGEIVVKGNIPQEPSVFAESDEGGTDGDGPIVEFVVFGKEESQGIGARKNDFHALHGVDVGKERGGINKVFEQCYFVDDDVPIIDMHESLHVAVERSERIGLHHFDVGGLFRRQVGRGLQCEDGFSGAPQAAEHADAAFGFVVEVSPDDVVSVASLKLPDAFRHGVKCRTGDDVRLIFGCVSRMRGGFH